MFVTKRIHAVASPEDGKRYLVDRVWPRGVSKERATLDGWLKDLAPSTELRTWFHHEPARWEDFKRRYQEELTASQAAQLLETLREEGKEHRVTLLFAAKDEVRNNAVCLKELLEEA